MAPHIALATAAPFTASSDDSSEPEPRPGGAEGDEIPREAAPRPPRGRHKKRWWKDKVRQCAVKLLLYVKFPAWLWSYYVDRRCGRFPPGAPRYVDFVTLSRSAPKERSPSADSAESVRLPLGELPPKGPGTVRLVLVSDTHERHREVALPEGDVLLHCGDILMSSTLSTLDRGHRVLADFNEWLASAPCKERVVIGGNHDWALEALPPHDRRGLLSAAYLLHDESVELPLSGVKVYGNSFSSGHSHNRAWQTPAPEVSHMCPGVDVVMSHAKSQFLEAQVLGKVRPLIWAFGHAHEGHGCGAVDGTLFVNASIADGSYVPIQPPFVVDIVNV